MLSVDGGVLCLAAGGVSNIFPLNMIYFCAVQYTVMLPKGTNMLTCATACWCCFHVAWDEQVLSAAWYLPSAESDMLEFEGVFSVADCSALCNTDCQFFTYDYKKNTCHVKKHNPASAQQG